MVLVVCCWRYAAKDCERIWRSKDVEVRTRLSGYLEVVTVVCHDCCRFLRMYVINIEGKHHERTQYQILAYEC